MKERVGLEKCQMQDHVTTANVDCVVNCTANTNSGFFARTNYTNTDTKPTLPLHYRYTKTTLLSRARICSMSTFDGFVSGRSIPADGNSR